MPTTSAFQTFPGGDFAGTTQDDLIQGATTDDYLFGFGGNDTLYGGMGHDALWGGLGNDLMQGGAGDDLYEVDSLGDQVIEAADPSTATTVRVSVLANGTQQTHSVWGVGLSATGNRVLLSSPGAFDAASSFSLFDLFVRDVSGGQMLSVLEPITGFWPSDFTGGGSLSADGRWLVFESFANNLDAADTNTFRDVFLRDLQTGTVSVLSVNADGESASGSSWAPVISSSGRYVAFLTTAPDLAGTTQQITTGAPQTGNGLWVLLDQQTGALTPAVLTAGNQLANAGILSLRLSSNEQHVVFSTHASNLTAGDDNNDHDVFIRNLTTGATTLVSVATDGTSATGWSSTPDVSADGRYVVFSSTAADLVADDTNGVSDVFMRDTVGGTTTRLSVVRGGGGLTQAAYNPTISDDGRFVVYESTDPDIVRSDTNAVSDAFLWDRATGETVRVSLDVAGHQLIGTSTGAKISKDGTQIIFESVGAVVATDTNGYQDVYRIANPFLVAGGGSGGHDRVRALINYTLPAYVEDLQLIGSSALTGIGNALGNTISGNEFANELRGGEGDDFLDGGAGDDQLFGDEGSDLLTGGTGNDVLDGGAGTNLLVGGDGDDVYRVRSSTDGILEGLDGGADRIEAYSGLTLNDAVYVERIELMGTTGVVTANNLNNVIIGDGLNNTIHGGAGSDFIQGLAGDDLLFGDAGNDALQGGDGDDQLDGGQGADEMVGGDGNDRYYVSEVGDQVVETDTGGVDTVVATGDYVLYANIENLTMADGALNGSGNAGLNWIVGNAANNWLAGAAGGDTIFGEGGHDAVNGDGCDDVLYGGDGDDVLDGGSGADTMTGGAGNDRYIIDNLADAVIEQADGGTDTVVVYVDNYVPFANVENVTLAEGILSASGSSADNWMEGNSGNNFLGGGLGHDALFGFAGNDYLKGDEGDDVLDAGEGDDVLEGNFGVDRMIGGNGNDTYYVDGPGDIIVETVTGGIDTVYSSGHYTLSGNLENLVMIGAQDVDGTGDGGENWMKGNTGNNTLSGMSNHDALFGMEGDDILIGGTGPDELAGGAGSDTYRYVAGDGDDQINDLDASASGSDTLELQGIARADTSYARQGNDLLITITPSADPLLSGQITVLGWFLGANYQIEQIVDASGARAAALINALVAPAPQSAPLGAMTSAAEMPVLLAVA